MTFTHNVNEASRQNHLDLAVCHRLFGDVRFFFGFVDHLYVVAAPDRFTKAGQDKNIVLIDLLPIGGIDKGKRQNAEVEKILPMNPGEALGNNRFEAEVSRRDGSMLAARSLAIVFAADDQ